jgi:hypothetical protein
MKCIYCLNKKSEKDFTIDHIMPKSFGIFEHSETKSNFTIVKGVCGECNQYFGDNLELHLARNSLEGVIRYGKTKPASEYKHSKKSRIMLKLISGKFKGAIVYYEYTHRNLFCHNFVIISNHSG